MGILADLGKALEENDIELSEAKRNAAKWESLYSEMCRRNKELIGEKATLQHNVGFLVNNQSLLLSKLKEVLQSDNLFTLRTDIEVFIEGLDLVKGMKV